MTNPRDTCSSKGWDGSRGFDPLDRSGQETFPGWHRAYLRDFERALIEAPCLSDGDPKPKSSRFTNPTMKMAITLATFPIFRRPNHIFFVFLCDIPMVCPLLMAHCSRKKRHIELFCYPDPGRDKRQSVIDKHWLINWGVPSQIVGINQNCTSNETTRGFGTQG